MNLHTSKEERGSWPKAPPTDGKIKIATKRKNTFPGKRRILKGVGGGWGERTEHFRGGEEISNSEGFNFPGEVAAALRD